MIPGLTPAVHPPPDWPLAWGTVGWDDDGGTFYELGSASNDGKTLIRVTLFRGRDPTVQLDASKAQGTRLLCQLAGGSFRIPPRGTPVLVAIPEPGGLIPGASVIIATSEPSPTVQFSLNRVVLDFGPDVHVVIKGKSVSIQSQSTPAQFVGVGTPASGGKPGVYALDETGSGFSTQGGEVAIFACSGGDVKSTCHLTSDTAEILNKGTQTCGVQCKSGDCTAMGANFRATCGMVYLGNPTTIAPVNGVAYTTAGPVNVISTTVFTAA